MKIRLFGKAFLIGLIPNFFVFVGQSNTVPQWLIKNLHFLGNLNSETIKDWCTAVGLVFTGVVLPYALSTLQETNKKQQEALNEILISWKGSLSAVFREAISRPNFNLSIRVFVKKKWNKYPVVDWIKVWQGKKIEFVLINLPNLADQDNTNGLCFEVKPRCQGVVGLIYNQDAVVIDHLVSAHAATYSLTNLQSQRVSHINFIMGGPVYDSKSNSAAAGKIIGIITFDSQETIRALNQAQEQKFRQIVVKYSDLVHKYLPLLTSKSQ